MPVKKPLTSMKGIRDKRKANRSFKRKIGLFQRRYNKINAVKLYVAVV
jgi:hypothetical protein